MRFTEVDEPVLSDTAGLSARQRIIVALLIDVPFYAARAGLHFAHANELVEHYIQIGWRENLDPSPTFQATRYAQAVSGSCENGKNPFAHYLFSVVGEEALDHALSGLSMEQAAKLRSHFNADWYVCENPDVDLSLNDPFVHYLTSGWRERRNPSSTFSTSFYLDLYADIRDSGINPLRHWVFHGIDEGRSSGVTSASSRIEFASWDDVSVRQQLILTRMLDLQYYRRQAPDAGFGDVVLAKNDMSGWTDAGIATSSFNAVKYLAAHPEIRTSGQVPFLYYLFRAVGEETLYDLFVAQALAIGEALVEHFDTAWYLYSYPDVEASGQDALIHYMTSGWRERRDPSRSFSTKAYLLRYPDIVDAGVNPFLHWIMYGQTEGRSGASSASNFRNRQYTPAITAVLINRHVDPLIAECVSAVAAQTYGDVSILVVGAPLSDGCRTALDGAVFRYLSEDGRLSSWKLLERAVEHANGDLLWFVQGAAVHDSEFLARLASSFADGSVQLGFGRQIEPDAADYAIAEEELSRRMQGWTRHVVTPAAIWFADQLRPDRLSAEHFSFLWRRRSLDRDIWQRASEYRDLGLWHLFLHMASGGQISTVRDAIMRLPSIRSPTLLDGDLHGDVDRLTAEVQSFWSVPSFARTKRHVLIVTHGIFAGGAENLPIQMANALAARGFIISLLIFKIELNAEMRATLDPGVSIYEADWVMEYGCELFLRDTGCSLIHSHGVIGEMFFFRLCEEPLPVPYVATLHGSYEASSSTELPEWFIAKIARNVDQFVYTADKNLAPLLRNGVRPERLIKMINAMPVDPTPFPKSRAELRIADDTIVFTMVARGIPEKGWSTAISAFKAVQRRNPRRSMHLCLVGEGDEPDRLKPLHADDATISFLGFQLRIHGLYRMTDVAIVPTRFAGESYPLCIIQALQVNVPVIATDIGEIASMLALNGVTGGIVVERSQIDEQFDTRFADAMHALVDDTRRTQLAAGASILGRGYDMGTFTDRYLAIYEDVLTRFCASSCALPVGSADRNAVDLA